MFVLLQTSKIIGRPATLVDMTNMRLLQVYELEDEDLAPSTKATICAEFSTLCKVALWLNESFDPDDSYAFLAHDIAAGALNDAIGEARRLCTSLQRRANVEKVSLGILQDAPQ